MLLVAGILVAALINFDFRDGPVFGLIKGSGDGAEFFKKEKLAGPIFSNYENGGYLIFHLSPQFKFFVDNRAEAFPSEFFQRMYIPMQMDETFWQAAERYFHFNTIFFSRYDRTVWAGKFIARRLKDPSWALVFMDDNILIFVKRSEQNADMIRQHEFKIIKFKGKSPVEIKK